MAFYLTVFVRFLSSASLPVGFCVWSNLTATDRCGGGVVAANTGSYKASDDSPPKCELSALSVFLLSSPPSLKCRHMSTFLTRNNQLKVRRRTFRAFNSHLSLKCITCVQVSMYLRRWANSCTTLHKMANVNPELFASIFSINSSSSPF